LVGIQSINQSKKTAMLPINITFQLTEIRQDHNRINQEINESIGRFKRLSAEDAYFETFTPALQCQFTDL
jgi:cell division protein ZapA (FtsZ GTPase activity inhibitor)